MSQRAGGAGTARAQVRAVSPAPPQLLLSLLLVDDDTRTVRRLAQLLRDDGFEVHTAADLRTARALASTIAVDVALMDVRLPDGDGRALASELLAASSSLRVIFITIYPELFAPTDPGTRCSSLTKPVDYAKLVNLLHALDDERQLHLPAGP